MGEFNKFLIRSILISIFTSSYSWGQLTTDLQIDDVVVVGETAPYEFCQGEVPQFEIQFSLKAGSTTLTLTATTTLEFTAIGSLGNVFTKTITGVTSFGSGSTELGPAGSDTYRWPVTGTDAIQLSANGPTDIIFKIFLNSTGFSDPDNPDAAVSTLSMDVNSNPPQVNITTSVGNFDGARRISVCDGDNLTLFADLGYSDYEFFSKDNGLLTFTSLGKSASNSVLMTNIFGGGEEVKVRTYNGDCFTDSLTYYIDVVSSTTVNLNTTLTGGAACDGDNISFTGIGSGNWYEFLIFTGGVTTTVQSSTSQTWSSTTLSDMDRVTVRNYTSSATTCSSEENVTVRINSFSNTNNISGDQSVCSSDVPGLLGSTTESVADRLGDGATVVYYWEKNEGIGWSTIGGSNASTINLLP